MHILQVLTYYRPHISGLTLYVEQLSKALVHQAQQVTVLTAQIEPLWPRREQRDGVSIVRVPVRGRISKGVWMPSFWLHALRLSHSADIVHIHLPQFDAPVVAALARLLRKPVVVTYHCDLRLPDGHLNRILNVGAALANRVTGALADVVVGYTRDYALHSPFLSRTPGRKFTIIPPPVAVFACTDDEAALFRARHKLEGKRVIGIVARLSAEKGFDVLLQALPEIIAAVPQAHIIHAGPTQHVVGEATYAAQLQPQLLRHEDRFTSLGVLSDTDLAAFYRNLDLLVVPSVNSTESFGLVQIEAMRHGVPVCAADLPGVRQPVRLTGMGRIFAVGDASALAEAVVAVLQSACIRRISAELLAATFDPALVARQYIDLYTAIRTGQFIPGVSEPAAYARLRNSHKPEPCENTPMRSAGSLPASPAD